METKIRSAFSVALLASFAGFAAAPALAGPLTPPLGAPASTFRTRAEVEPRTPVGFATTPGDADGVLVGTTESGVTATGHRIPIERNCTTRNRVRIHALGNGSLLIGNNSSGNTKPCSFTIRNRCGYVGGGSGVGNPVESAGPGSVPTADPYANPSY